MIYGIGCDLCDIERMRQILTKHSGSTFVRRVYGERERAELGLESVAQDCSRRLAERAAANFAAKEAFLKAAGVGLCGDFAMGEIQALRHASGAPFYQLEGKAAEWLKTQGLTAHLSMSHESGLALAYCILEGDTARPHPEEKGG